jgi:hypothetical protein
MAELPVEYDEQAFDVYTPPPDNITDPHSNHTRNLAVALERARGHLTYRKAQFIEYMFKGYGSKRAAELAGFANAPGGMRARLEDQESPERIYMNILREVYLLNMGPTIAMRKALLWDIAINHKDKSPAASIKAVDVLNRMDGLYVQDDSPTLTVNQTIYQNLPWGDLARLSSAAKDVIEHV